MKGEKEGGREDRMRGGKERGRVKGGWERAREGGKGRKEGKIG